MNTSHPSSQATLNYRLRPNSKGVRLDIWENTPEFDPGQASYRFFVTYQLNSADDAQTILESYLAANDIHHAVPSNDAVTPVHLRTLVGTSSQQIG